MVSRDTDAPMGGPGHDLPRTRRAPHQERLFELWSAVLGPPQAQEHAVPRAAVRIDLVWQTHDVSTYFGPLGPYLENRVVVVEAESGRLTARKYRSHLFKGLWVALEHWSKPASARGEPPLLLIVAATATRVLRHAGLTSLRPGIHVGTLAGVLDCAIVELLRLDDENDMLGLHTVRWPSDDATDSALHRYLRHPDTPSHVRRAIEERLMNKAIHDVLPEGMTYYDLAVEEGRKEGRKEGRRTGRKEGRRTGRKEGRREALIQLANSLELTLTDAELERCGADDLAALIAERIRAR